MFRIILIDDDSDDCLLVKDLLSENYGADFEFFWAATAAIGLEAIGEKQFDICLVDYSLGQEDGIELIAAVKATGQQMAIVLLTGQGDRDVDIEAMRAGATDYLSKQGLSAATLDRKIRYAIAREDSRQRRHQQGLGCSPKVLLIEDDEDDYILVRDMLADIYGDEFSLQWVQYWDKALKEIGDTSYDVCLLDYCLGDQNGLELVREALTHEVDFPLILLTGHGSREIDLESMRVGASDYLDKSEINPPMLDRAIRYAMERYRAEQRAAERSLSEGPRIALIEDDEDDYLITRDLLSEIYGTTFSLDWIQSWAPALEAIGDRGHDVYLVDYRLGEGNGLDLIREAVERGCKAPIILLTGESSREIDLEAMKVGASDYLVKGEISAPLLDRAIRYSIERNRSEMRLTELAQYDQLTGLANRMLFKDYLTSALARAQRTGEMVAVMLIDLDRFKFINDTYGHDAGDQLLKVVSQRLKDSIRASDLVARFGGDEFTVVLSGVQDPTIITHFGDRILNVIKQPISIGGNQIFTTASVGIAIYPNDVENIEDLIKSADAAMYRAKELGSDNYQFYTVELHIKAARRQEIERGLRNALERDEFLLLYQPQFALETGRVIGFEALLRWQHPSWGRVGPDQFIDLAEDTGLIVPIGELVMHKAFMRARKFWDLGWRDFRVAVNLSPRQFQELNLKKTVKSIMEQCEVPADLIEIEITESSILTDAARVRAMLEDFNDMGLLVALDDFGTGYSSLNHLRSFPGASIKIDRSFVMNVMENSSDAAIVRAVIAMAHNLGLRVIAEGVETEDQLAFLQEEGCDAVQGFLLCKPLMPDQLSMECLSAISAKLRDSRPESIRAIV